MADRILIAVIGAPHGVGGEVRLKPYTADPMSVAAYGPLATADGRTFVVERLRPVKGAVIAKFCGIDDRNVAEALNGVSLYTRRERLPAAEEDEFYHADLIGLAAVTKDGELLGNVVAVHNFGAGDILDIASLRGPALLVPFTNEAAPVVDVAAGHIVVVPPLETEAREEET